MNQLRLRLIVFSIWLAVFFRIEQVVPPMSFNNVAYLWMLIIIIAILISSRWVKLPLWSIVAVPITIFIILKGLGGALSDSMTVVITIGEATALAITTLLAHWLSLSIYQFETTIARITIGQDHAPTESSESGQGYLYREVRRARNHQRPIAIMSVTVDEKTFAASLSRMVQQVQLSFMKQYMLSGVSKTLQEQLEDCTVIVQEEDRFLIALPETRSEDLRFIIDRLRKNAAEKVGVNLVIGSAVMPEDGYTFEGLIEKASSAMKADLKTQSVGDTQSVANKDTMTVMK